MFEDMRKDVAKNINQMEIDTIVVSMIPSFSQEHPFMKGLKQKAEKRTGKQIDRLDSYSYPADTFAKNSIIMFKDVKSTYANVEVKANNKRDRILLAIPEWIKRILVFLLMFQFYKILGNVNKNVVFDLKNVRRIRLIGFIMIGFFIESFFATYLYQTYLLNGFYSSLSYIPSFSIHYRDYQGININFNVMQEVKPTNLYVGLITLTLATIFKRGLALQQEQDLTV